MSLLELKCPVCKGTLWIDISSGKVVDSKSADHKTTDFDSFVQSQKDRSGKWDNKLQKAKGEIEKRKAEIEEKFRQAKEHPDQLKDDYQSPFKWD